LNLSEIELTGGWRKLHAEELHTTLYSSYIIRMRLIGVVACMGEMRMSTKF